MELVPLARMELEYRSLEAVRFAVGALVRPEPDGLATLRVEDGARVFVTACGLRSGDGPYAWVNTVVGVVEGVLDTDTGVARAVVHECRPTLV